MINVVVVSNNLDSEMQLLAQQKDMRVAKVELTNLDNILQQVAEYHPEVIIIEQGTENVSADILCHFLSHQYPDARNLILCSEEPTFEMLQNSGFKARGYILPEQRDVLDKAVRVVHDGEAWLPRKLVANMLNRFAASFFQADEDHIALVSNQ